MALVAALCMKVYRMSTRWRAVGLEGWCETDLLRARRVEDTQNIYRGWKNVDPAHISACETYHCYPNMPSFLQS